MKGTVIICCALLTAFMLIIAGCGGDDGDEKKMDVKPPEVTDVIAAGGTSAAATNGQIMLVFNETVDPASVQAALLFTPQADGSISYNEESRTLIFKPKSDLQAHTKYSITVNNVADKAGNVIEPYTFDILTGDKDVKSPIIMGTTPRTGNEEASVEPRFYLEFNERVDQMNFGQDLSLDPDPGVPADRWVHTWSEDGKQVEMWIPLERGLEPEKKYKLTIGRNSAQDLAGNKMDKSLQIAFTTTERQYENIDPTALASLPAVWLYQIWKQGNTWHIVWGGTSPAGATKTGAGTISIEDEDGGIDDVGEVMWEAGDIHSLNKDGTSLTFSGPVNGTGGQDGLTFEAKGKTVKFRLSNARPEWIFIGKDLKNPEATTFSLLNDED